MANHRWTADVEHQHGTKPHHCKRCGWNKVWYGGDYQCWNYYFTETITGMDGKLYGKTTESFQRPECIPTIKNQTIADYEKQKKKKKKWLGQEGCLN